MKRILVLLITIASFFQFGCKSPSDNPTPEKIVGDYFTGLNESNFKQIESCISDSFRIMEGGFVLAQSSKDFYVHFQWDSVFSPKYNILNSKRISENSIEVTLSKICERIKFLHDTVTVYKARIDLADNQIVKIDNFELVVFDTLKWTTRRDTLVAWIKTNYPDLDGFVYDQTLTGAQNYMKAIDLFQTME